VTADILGGIELSLGEVALEDRLGGTSSGCDSLMRMRTAAETRRI
jgi:hypothetical protein